MTTTPTTAPTGTPTGTPTVGRRAVIFVDVQPTFCEGGELAVTGGNDCAAAIAEYIRAHAGDYSLRVTTQDWHVDPGAHFSDTPDFVDSWPPHGIAESENAELHPAVDKALDYTTGSLLTIRKGQYAAAYSGFDGTAHDGRTLFEHLTERGITALDVCGIAESHCVKATVLDAITAGFDVTVLTDLTVPVTPELGAQAREQMRQAGATSLTAAQAAARNENETVSWA